MSKKNVHIKSNKHRCYPRVLQLLSQFVHVCILGACHSDKMRNTQNQYGWIVLLENTQAPDSVIRHGKLYFAV